MSLTLLVIGAGGHARVIADSAKESGHWPRIEFYDDAWPELLYSGSWSVSGSIASLLEKPTEPDWHVVIGIGNNALRFQLQEQFAASGWHIATIIHPSAIISRDVEIGAGTVIMAGAVVNTGARLGGGCVINTRSSVDHDCLLGNAVHLSPGTTLSGAVTIGDCTWIGSGSTISNNLHIGAHVIIGAGATVITDIPDHSLAVGTPAKVKRSL